MVATEPLIFRHSTAVNYGFQQLSTIALVKGWDGDNSIPMQLESTPSNHVTQAAHATPAKSPNSPHLNANPSNLTQATRWSVPTSLDVLFMQYSPGH